MTEDVDLLVVGAGPAGLSGAALAAELGLTAMLVDDQPEPGGQIYRAIRSTAARRPGLLPVLGADYGRGLDLLATFDRAEVTYLDRAAVWDVAQDRSVTFSRLGETRRVRPKHLLIATGAMERPLPAPGATLPGIMTVGALQILLKTAGIVADRRLVLAGAGPLLLLLANQYLRAGVRIAAILDTTRPGNALAALGQLPRALRGAADLGKGLGMMTTLARSGVPVYRGVAELRVLGATAAAAVAFRQGARAVELAADLVGLHDGVVPHTQLARLVGCRHGWDPAQHCFRPVLDAWGETDKAGVWIAGDAGGIAGARAAEHAARLAVLAVAQRVGRIGRGERDRRAQRERRALARHRAIRPFLDRLYAPGDAGRHPPDEAILCRCEEVAAAELRAAARAGCVGVNQAKAFLRCGMGPCQGRMCGLAVAQTMAAERGCSPAETGYFRVRPPLVPTTLAAFAASGANAQHPEET